jgi:hypothetical protein
MNRANDRQCYKCRAPKDEATLATVANRSQDVVLTPGLDEEHREVAWTLMFRQKYISAWKIGYLAAGMLLVTLVLATFLAVVSVAVIVGASSLNPDQLSAGQTAAIGLVGLLFILSFLATAFVHSVFLCLTSMAAPALGSGSPRFDPVRAAVWWIESFLWAVRGGLAFVIPPLMCFVGIIFGGLIFGLAIGVVWAVCAFWVLGDPISNLGKPKRLPEDLWNRLATPGSADSRLVTLWSAAWGVGRGVEYAVSAMTFLAFIVFVMFEFLISILGLQVQPASQSQAELMGRLTANVVVIVQLVADGIAFFLLARVTIELSRRQRIREAWVLGGLEDARAKAYAEAQVRDAATRVSAAQPPAVAQQPSHTPPAAARPAWTETLQPLTAPTTAPWAPSSQQFAPPSAQQFVLPTQTPPPASATADVGPAAQPKDAADQPIIKPSTSNLSRYRAPFEGAPPAGTPPDRPAESPPNDLDAGGGI